MQDIEPDDGELTASFDGRPVTYGFGELDALVPAYAASRRHRSKQRVRAAPLVEAPRVAPFGSRSPSNGGALAKPSAVAPAPLRDPAGYDFLPVHGQRSPRYCL